MKTMFRVSVLGLLLFAVVAVANQDAYAQDDKTALYTKVTENYDGDLSQRKIAVKAGREYLAKYGNDPENQAVVDWLKSAIPDIEEGIKDDEERIRKAEERKARLNKFDTSYRAQKWDAAFDAGEEILRAEPDFYDVAIVLASRAYSEALGGNNSHNDEAVKYSKLAIEKMKAGAKSKSGFYGGYDFQYKSDPKSDPNGKYVTDEQARENALGWMNFHVGWIMFYRQNKKDAAIPYLYEATKYDSGSKEYEITYRAIGAWYVSKLGDILKERNALLEQRNAAAETEIPDAETRKALEEKIKELDAKIDAQIAMERGYADRAIDAYSRAYDALSKEDKASDYGKNTFARLQELHRLRYADKQEMQTDAAINMNVAMINKKPMPDPTAEVEPIKMVKPVDSAESTDEKKSGASRNRTVSEKKPAGNN